MKKALLILFALVAMSASAQEEDKQGREMVITKSPYITLLGKEYAIGDWHPFILKLAKDTTFHIWELSSKEITAIYNNRNLRKKSYERLWLDHLVYLRNNLYNKKNPDKSLIEWTKRNLKNIEDGYENSPLEKSPKKECRFYMEIIKKYLEEE